MGYKVLSVPSEALEGQVAVEAEDGLLPEEDEGGLVHGLDAVVDQLHGVPKGTGTVSSCKGHLRLAALEAVWVLVLALVVGEEALTGRCIVCILAG